MSMKIFMTITDLSLASGGPSRSVPALASVLGKLGINVSLFALDRGTTNKEFDQKQTYNLILKQSPDNFWGNFNTSKIVAQMIQEEILKGSRPIIHSHGLWSVVNWQAARVAQKFKIPHIITPRGMLEPWALSQGRFRKKFALSLFQNRDLASSRLIHATAIQEAESIRAIGLRNPIVVIPNGVDIPTWEEKVINSHECHTVLFLSRIHKKKGLLNLVKSWARIRPNKWRAIIAGPDEGNHQSEVCNAIKKANLQNDFEFVGPVEGEAKWDLYGRSDLFVLPTFSENFGIVVAEALGCGLPVITTKGAPWAELEEHKCGWWIDIGVDPLTQALEEAMSLSPEERQAMGLRGRKLIERNYSWNKIGKEMISVYEWVIAGGTPPTSLILD